MAGSLRTTSWLGLLLALNFAVSPGSLEINWTISCPVGKFLMDPNKDNAHYFTACIVTVVPTGAYCACR